MERWLITAFLMTPDPAWHANKVLPVAVAEHDAQRLKPFRLRFQKFNVLLAHRQSAFMRIAYSGSSRSGWM